VIDIESSKERISEPRGNFTSATLLSLDAFDDAYYNEESYVLPPGFSTATTIPALFPTGFPVDHTNPRGYPKPTNLLLEYMDPRKLRSMHVECNSP
jgi:hypothetical protein